MKNEHLKTLEQSEAVICICSDNPTTTKSLRSLILSRAPEVMVCEFGSLADIAPNKINPKQLEPVFFLIFSMKEAEWKRIAYRRSTLWPLRNSVSSLALVDSAAKGFLREIFEAGVDDYFLDTPAGCEAAVAQVIRAIEKRTLVECEPGKNFPKKTNDNSLAERIRQETFRETVATINHQINNPLSEILATVEMLDAQECDSGGLPPGRLNDIHRSANRIQQVTSGLMNAVNLDSRRTPAGNMIDIPIDSQSRTPLLKKSVTSSPAPKVTPPRVEFTLPAEILETE